MNPLKKLDWNVTDKLDHFWWVTGLALFEAPLILGAQDKLPLLPPPRSCRQHWFLSTNTYRRDAIRQCFSSSDCCLPFLHWAASWQYTAQLNRVVLLYKRKKPSRADIDVDCTPSNLVNCRSITTVINNNTSKYKPNMKVSMWDIINILHTTRNCVTADGLWHGPTQYYNIMYSSTSGVKVHIM